MDNDILSWRCRTDQHGDNLQKLYGQRFKINSLKTERNWLKYASTLVPFQLNHPF